MLNGVSFFLKPDVLLFQKCKSIEDLQVQFAHLQRMVMTAVNDANCLIIDTTLTVLLQRYL